MLSRPLDFFNLYSHGFIRAAICIPEVRVADTYFNADRTIQMAKEAAAGKAIFALFPELNLSAYSNEDLFHQDTLQKSVYDALFRVARETASLNLVLVVGAPIRVDCRLYNCGVVLYHGRILGIAVKSYLPNYREFYELRQFSPADQIITATIDLGDQKDIPFGANLVFEVKNIPDFKFFVEICEDVWVPIPPSSFAAMAGATVIANLSASNITIGKAEYRQSLAANQSARCVSAYLYAASGPGESTTDLAWDGHAMIHENGNLLSESQRFSRTPQIVHADIDLDRLAQDRMRLTSFGHNARAHKDILCRFRRIAFEVAPVEGRRLLERQYPRFPYIPADPNTRDQRCYEAYNIQVQGLAKRLESAGIKNVVIGISGGLDSTHALIVAAKTMDLLGFPRSCIKAYTMPGFATTDKTYRNSLRLMKVLEVEANEIDIRPSCMQMLKDIQHPFAEGERLYDITFENIQAGERTSHLFRIANMRNALVIGTGDLSELALGWCTYGVGDHMSHYNVNASLPKTLIQHLIRWVASSKQFSGETSEVLLDILATEISPELVPGEEDQQPAQKTESVIGPYELQDFNNFYTTRFGYLPTKIAFLAYCTWKDKREGLWPDIPEEKQHQYTIAEIKHWLQVYLLRFFKLSQYKRSCIPNSPKVGSGGSLSPRGDYRAPSDSEATVWLKNAEQIPENDD
ncbi:NAD+ synthase (glutamine-hydrolysing) [Syntrophus gentianae]|uniref:Glutamine-dependent NAD(+) synthetase n=1 Tax=Syntrophus gentianae TaxID=43775 RepID=A0A1H7WPU4_9BACT|nr:NAD(+) synthase [Syntrophus gentianae]SEM23463.1 NAD+ synthase (glutamine-hydrolysing) [Syntrophus gentianae]